MKKAIFLFAFLFISNCFSQDKFYKGLWKTNDKYPITKITATDFSVPKIFKITNENTYDGVILEFDIIVDNNSFVAKLSEGSSVFIEGKSLSIRQFAKGNSLPTAIWEIVGNEAFDESLKWSAFPNNRRNLICSFLAQTEFVLTLEALSPDCSGGEMMVFIDGLPILNADKKPNVFLEGSSVVGKGKIIEVSINSTGMCATNNSFKGNLKYKKI